MDDQDRRDSEHDAQDDVARARALILSRRRALMAAAMTGLGVVGACTSKTTVCLSIARPPTQEEPDAAPSICLSVDAGPERMDSGRPTVCLSQPYPPPYPMDAAVEEDGGRPSVCLSPPPPNQKGLTKG